MKDLLQRLASILVTSLLLVCLFAPAASAQTVITPSVPAVVTGTTVVIALLSIVVGYIGQALRTGNFLGLVSVPQTWVPYLTILGTFLTASVVSLSGAAVVNGAAWIQAALAGFIALGGMTFGVTIQQHATGKGGAPQLPSETPTVPDVSAPKR